MRLAYGDGAISISIWKDEIMASAQKPPAGPDFAAAGIALADLVDGEMVLGHADREPVLMVRRGDEIFAVGAECTHYGGPLAKGLLLGDTVRCPWHHACFSVRTGEAIRAPALDPLPRWTVEQRDGRVYITRKHDRDPLAPAPGDQSRTESATPAAIVIVGAGGAGYAAAEMLRRQGFQGRLTIIDGDVDAPYDRPPLSKSFLSGKSESVALRPAGFYEAHGIELVRSSATAVDSHGQRVHLADGSSIGFDALLLATGGEPRLLDIPGHDRPHVHTLRSLSDSRAIIAVAERSHRAVVMGASFIGLEVAAALRARDLEVHVVAPGSQPLAKVLGPELGAMIQAQHEEHGVIFHLGQTAAVIEDEAVVLQNGERLPADLVVVGIGVRPRLDLAQAAGLTLDRGVVVNEYLETSAPGIYAAGDITRWPDPHTGKQIRVEHWVLAQRQGQVAARNMLGARERFDAAPFFWSQHYNFSVRYTGHAEQWDRIDVDGLVADRAFSAAFRRDGKTLAVASVKRDRENLEAEVALEANDEPALKRLVAAN
jgi:NADPH-dependent 2,4-dienoyl-CoA reductase/sulfur reductase-like enzyme/nitrite reductase/ring-hydroxylating ferredoxin subunit